MMSFVGLAEGGEDVGGSLDLVCTRIVVPGNTLFARGVNERYQASL